MDYLSNNKDIEKFHLDFLYYNVPYGYHETYANDNRLVVQQ